MEGGAGGGGGGSPWTLSILTIATQLKCAQATHIKTIYASPH
jgi:hypothetical protein